MLGFRRVVSAVALVLFSVVGCKRPQPTPTTTAAADAGPTLTAATAKVTDAAPAEEPPIPTDKTLRPVAVSHGPIDAFKTPDGRVFFAIGPMVYEGKRDGTLVPVVEPSELGPFVGDDETLIGFLAPMPVVTNISADPNGALRLTSSVDSKKYLLADGKLRPIDGSKSTLRAVGSLDKNVIGIATVATEKETATLVGVSDGATAPALPAGHSAFDVTNAADGSLVVFTKNGKQQSLVIFGKASDAPRVVAFERPALGGTTSCNFIHPELDGRVTIRCASAAWESGTVKAQYHRLNGETFEKVYEGAPADLSSSAIAKDGTLFVTASNKMDVSRCPEHGKCEKVTVEKPAARKDDKSASYVWRDTDALEREGSRYWSALRVETESKDAFDYLSSSEIVSAKSETDIWMMARYANATVLLHTNPERERVRLPSRVDARLIVRNVKAAPQPWTGHCDHVFVRMDPDAVAKRMKEIGSILAFASADEDSYYGAPFGFEIVEGTLHQAKVTGVVVHRNDVEGNLATMEAAVERLVNKFAVNPMNRPSVTCTLPVLSAKLGP